MIAASWSKNLNQFPVFVCREIKFVSMSMSCIYTWSYGSKSWPEIEYFVAFPPVVVAPFAEDKRTHHSTPPCADMSDRTQNTAITIFNNCVWLTWRSPPGCIGWEALALWFHATNNSTKNADRSYTVTQRSGQGRQQFRDSFMPCLGDRAISLSSWIVWY